jgi:hypothetical protein
LSPCARLGRLNGGYGESRAFCSPLTQENPDWQQAEQIESLVGLALAVLITRITNVLARLIWRQEYLDSGRSSRFSTGFPLQTERYRFKARLYHPVDGTRTMVGHR